MWLVSVRQVQQSDSSKKRRGRRGKVQKLFVSVQLGYTQSLHCSGPAKIRLRKTRSAFMSNDTGIEYRGYTLEPVQRSPGWRIYIYPGPHLLRTDPDHVSAATKEEALAKARATVDHRLTR